MKQGITTLTTSTTVANVVAGSKDQGTISLGSGSGVVTRFHDNTNERLNVQHYVIVEKTDKYDKTTFNPELSLQFPAVETPFPEPIVRFSRSEDKPPVDKKFDFEGTVNIGSLGPRTWLAPRTWLCIRITGDSIDAGVTYNVVYEFQIRSTTWDTLVQWTDPDTGEVPDDLVEGLGTKQYRMYPETDFSKLGLPFENLIG